MLLILPILPFAVYKYNVMRYYDETNIIISSHHDYFNQNFTLSSSDHEFTLAYAFIAFDEADPVEDISRYGEVKAFYKRWGNPGDPVGTTFHELSTRPCTEAELGLTSDSQVSRF